MDIIIVREAITVISFLVFLGIVAWAYSSGSKRDFEQAAHLPFEEGDELNGKSRGER